MIVNSAMASAITSHYSPDVVFEPVDDRMSCLEIETAQNAGWGRTSLSHPLYRWRVEMSSYSRVTLPDIGA